MHLIIFFTKEMSLVGWDRSGILKREIALYKRLGSKGYDISFITYGNNEDLNYIDQLGGIKVLCNKWGLPKYLYNKYLHIIHRKHLKSCNIIKTNQMFGADIALKSAKLYDKPLINRMGYMWSDFTKQENGDFQEIINYEENIFHNSDKIVVTTQEMYQSIVSRYKGLKNKISIIPNYVNTELFKPSDNFTKEFDILFIGRITHQKNVQGLLEALKDLNIKAFIIGDGDLKKGLIEQYGNLDGRVVWQDAIPHNDLPNTMNRCLIYILLSFYEGHPKTLIEAMAAGMPVIGTDVPGIREIIENRKNGMLCGTEANDIKSAIEKLLTNQVLCKKLGQNANNYAIQHFSLEKILDMELSLYNSLLENFHN
jgi:glycosyltransferase involved in cell wall biosynthesis